MIRAHKKLDDSLVCAAEEVQNSDISEILTSLYNKYGDLLDSFLKYLEII
jgi:hypothetical protein